VDQSAGFTQDTSLLLLTSPPVISVFDTNTFSTLWCCIIKSTLYLHIYFLTVYFSMTALCIVWLREYFHDGVLHTYVSCQLCNIDTLYRQQWKFGSALSRPKLKVVMPSEVRVVTMDDSAFSTVKYLLRSGRSSNCRTCFSG